MLAAFCLMFLLVVGSVYSQCLDPSCSGKGECINSTCICNDGYANANCSYSMKSGLAAFLLAFFLGGVGADRFYLYYYWQGGLILGLFICACCGSCIYKIGFGKGNSSSGYEKLETDGNKNCCNILGILIFGLIPCCINLGIVIWVIVDVVLIGIGDTKDAHGFKITPL